MAAKTAGAVQVLKDDTVKRTPMARPSIGREGKPIRLLSNHFAVKLRGVNAVFYQYSVSIKSEDDKVVDGKGIGRKVIDKLLQTYSSELDGKDFAYDGEKCLFTVGPLPQNNFEFTVVLEETSSRWSAVCGEVRKGLNSMIILGAWTIWKHHNDCVFNGTTPNITTALMSTKDEANSWSMAGAKGITLLTPRGVG